MLYVARCVVASRLLRDRLSDETKANVWPETLDPRERKDHLVTKKMSLQYIEFSFNVQFIEYTFCIYYSQLIRDIHTPRERKDWKWQKEFVLSQSIQ